MKEIKFRITRPNISKGNLERIILFEIPYMDILRVSNIANYIRTNNEK